MRPWLKLFESRQRLHSRLGVRRWWCSCRWNRWSAHQTSSYRLPRLSRQKLLLGYLQSLCCRGTASCCALRGPLSDTFRFRRGGGASASHWPPTRYAHDHHRRRRNESVGDSACEGLLSTHPDWLYMDCGLQCHLLSRTKTLLRHYGQS